MKKILVICLLFGIFSCQKQDTSSKRLSKTELAVALGVKEESLFTDEKTRSEFEENGGIYLKFKTLEEANQYLSKIQKKSDSLTKANSALKKKIDSIFKLGNVKVIKSESSDLP